MEDEDKLRQLWIDIVKGEHKMCKAYNQTYLLGYRMALEDVLGIQRPKGAPMLADWQDAVN